MNSLLLAICIVAHEPGYTTSLANHLQRWLKGEQVAAQVVTPAQMPTALAAERLAFLVGFNEPTEQRFWFDVKELPVEKDFAIEVRARNCFGKCSRPLVSGVRRVVSAEKAPKRK